MSEQHRTDYFLQILESIGAPLMVPVLAQGEKAPEDIAKHMAELLAQSVQASIALGPLIDIDKLGDQSDSARVALAGLSAHMIAALYQHLGHMPAESDIKKLKDGLEATIAFADNFTASPESTMRLETIKAGGQTVDAPQSLVQVMNSFLPVIQAVSAFSFGQPEAKLISDIAARLTTKAEEIAKTHFTSHSGDDLKAVERGILQALATIYAAAHDAETKRLNSTADREKTEASLETVWKEFDTQVQIVEALTQTLATGTSGGDVAPTAEAAPTPVTETPPPPSSPPPAAEEAPASPPPAGSVGNPMSFFTPPGADDEAEEAPSPPPATETPPPSPPTPPAETPAAEKPADTDDKPAGQAGNPMSFFSAPKSDDGDEE